MAGLTSWCCFVDQFLLFFALHSVVLNVILGGLGHETLKPYHLEIELLFKSIRWGQQKGTHITITLHRRAQDRTCSIPGSVKHIRAGYDIWSIGYVWQYLLHRVWSLSGWIEANDILARCFKLSSSFIKPSDWKRHIEDIGNQVAYLCSPFTWFVVIISFLILPQQMPIILPLLFPG